MITKNAKILSPEERARAKKYYEEHKQLILRKNKARKRKLNKGFLLGSKRIGNAISGGTLIAGVGRGGIMGSRHIIYSDNMQNLGGKAPETGSIRGLRVINSETLKIASKILYNK